MAAVVATLAFALLGACSPTARTEKNASGAVILNWFLAPDRVNAAAIAKSCSAASGGAYDIHVRPLPADADERHNVLIRRLTAKDPSIDLVGLDDSFTAEFAADQLLAPIPDDLAPIYSQNVFPKVLAAATYNGSLVAAPWWMDPQVLWYRGTVAERAGLDVTKPVAWDKLLEGAARLGVSVEIDNQNGRGIADLVAGLVADAGGKVVDGHGRKSPVGLAGAAGVAAAATVRLYNQSGNDHGPSADALVRFAGTNGGFLLAPTSVLSDPALASVVTDMKSVSYPVIDASSAGVAPLAGVNLAVPLFASHSDLSFKAITCLTSDSTMNALMTSAAHGSARSTTYDEPGVAASFPMAMIAKAAVLTGETVPQTPYWPLVRAGLQKSWLPLGSVSASSTPRTSQRVVAAYLAGTLP